MSKEAMKLALDALENAEYGDYDKKELNEAITALREALAEQPARQEPVAMRYDFDGYGWKYIDSGSGSDWQTRIKDAEPIYATQPQRTWVGLTDEEVVDLKMLGRDLEFVSMTALRRFARDIAQTLKEKNT